jgi:hypothetical protein
MLPLPTPQLEPFTKTNPLYSMRTVLFWDATAEGFLFHHCHCRGLSLPPQISPRVYPSLVKPLRIPHGNCIPVLAKTKQSALYGMK